VIKNKNKKVFNIGINDADYDTSRSEKVGMVWKQVWRCPYFERWYSILRRCYSEKYQNKQPTYKDCSVCEEWLTFSNFKAWMEQQDWEGKHLDKDLLVEGNKVYSPETCVFIDRVVNTFMTERSNHRGNYPIGVTLFNGKFVAQCSNPLTGKRGYIGIYTSVDTAHKAYCIKKFEYAKILAGIQKDTRVATALVDRYKVNDNKQ
jgi:hypothetical protein